MLIALTRTAITASLIAAALSPCSAQEDFPHIPENNWVFQTLLNFRKAGIPKEFPELVLRGTPSRFEVASAVLLIHDGLDQIFKAIESDFEEIIRRPISYAETVVALRPILDRVYEFIGYGKNIESLKRILDLFQPELASLGKDASELKIHLSVLQTRNSPIRVRVSNWGETRVFQFEDVPKAIGYTMHSKTVGTVATFSATRTNGFEAADR